MEWVTGTILVIMTLNLLACGWSGWRQRHEGNYNRVFSIIFYTLGVLFGIITVYVIATGQL